MKIKLENSEFIVHSFNINHFDLIFLLKKFKNSKYLKIIDDLRSPQREELVLETIKKEFSDFFVLERYELIKRIIKTRFSILREEVCIGNSCP